MPIILERKGRGLWYPGGSGDGDAKMDKSDVNMIHAEPIGFGSDLNAF